MRLASLMLAGHAASVVFVPKSAISRFLASDFSESPHRHALSFEQPRHDSDTPSPAPIPPPGPRGLVKGGAGCRAVDYSFRRLTRIVFICARVNQSEHV